MFHLLGNHDALTTLLKCPNIIMEPTDAQGSTPLHLAATYNQPEIAKILLTDGNATPAARGASINYVCKTPPIFDPLSVDKFTKVKKI